MPFFFFRNYKCKKYLLLVSDEFIFTGCSRETKFVTGSGATMPEDSKDNAGRHKFTFHDILSWFIGYCNLKKVLKVRVVMDSASTLPEETKHFASGPKFTSHDRLIWFTGKCNLKKCIESKSCHGGLQKLCSRQPWLTLGLQMMVGHTP